MFGCRIVVLAILAFSCSDHQSGPSPKHREAPRILKIEKNKIKRVPAPDSLLLHLTALGLVNVHEIDSTIKVDLKYSTKDNFLGEDVYGSLDEAFLQREVAEKLGRASFYLRKMYPGYRIIIYDAARPLSIQKKMWNMLNMPAREKKQYISNPKEGSLHNFGAAVDVSILGSDGNELDMGTDFDYFGVLAFPEKEDSLLKTGSLKIHQVKNRILLRGVMYKAGFFNIQTEWWHFNACTRDSAKIKYKLVE